MPDLAPYKIGEDVRFYIEKFENSYLGITKSDPYKILRLINKFQNDEAIYKTCTKNRHFKSFKYFKKEIIENHAKIEDIISAEFDAMEKNPDEFVY